MILWRPIQRLHPNYHWSFNVRMDGRKDIHTTPGAGDLKRKPKTVKLLRRPVSTQASSYEDASVRDAMVEPEDGSQAQEVNMSTSSSIANAEEDDNGGNSAVEGNSMLSSVRHSVSVEERIEKEMGVKIRFPSSSMEESISIEGRSVDSITRVSEKIQSIINEAVNGPNMDYSHFVSLPLAMHPELVGKLVKFQNNILGIADNERNKVVAQKPDKRSNVAGELEVDHGNKNARGKMPLVSYPPKASTSSKLSDLGIEKSIFINPRTFHLTVLMLKLWNKDRINTATKVLRNVSSKVMDALDNRPILIRLKGLDCMRGSPGKARVVYAPVEEVGNRGRLMRACQVITDAFVEAGLVLEKDANHKLKLHATVMNARYRKRNSDLKMDSFDARGIFEQYGSEEWGEYLIPEAHLSQRFAYDANGYYRCCASIPFPQTFHAN